jgi:hypothetical protein
MRRWAGLVLAALPVMVAITVMLVGPGSSVAQNSLERPPAPDDFAIVFTLGYAGDLLPQETSAFSDVMGTVADGGFNTVMASHEEGRLDVMEQHGLELMVDLLDSRHHVYKNLEGAEALATSLRGDARVWGYHLFSDTTSDVVPGRQRDIDNVRAWDPTHPTFVGVKHHVGGAIRQMTSPDVVGYYDYHWVRDRSIHFPNLAFFARYADEHDAPLYRWVWVENGRAGIGNPNRSRYTVFSSLAFGLDGVMWFIGQQMINTGNWQWNQFGLDTIGVNKDLLPVGQAMIGLRRVGTWSTPATRNANDRERGAEEPPIPPGLEAIPAQAFFQVEGGEVVVGHFQGPVADGEGGGGGGGGSGEDPAGGLVDHLLVANHNAYQPQAMAVRFEEDVTGLEILDRATGAWVDLPLEGGVATWELGPGYGDLLRVGRSGAEAPTPEPTGQATVEVTPEPTPGVTPEIPPAPSIYLPAARR